MVRRILFLLCSGVLGYVVLEVCLQMVLFMLILVYTILKQLFEHLQSMHCCRCTPHVEPRSIRLELSEPIGRHMSGQVLLYTTRSIIFSDDGEIGQVLKMYCV